MLKYCRGAGITELASRLYTEGMPLEEISVYVGHEDTDTTKGYFYNYNEVEKNCAYKAKAL